jgi:HprK-related kinase A
VKLGDLAADDLARRVRGAGAAFRTGPFVCCVRSPIAEIAQALHFAYADFPAEPSEGFADFRVHLAPPGGLRRWLKPQVFFYVDGRAPFKPFPLRLAVPLMEWGLNWCVVTRAYRYLMIHAAVLEREGRAVILPGKPGSGKSTLAAALALRGWRLLTDEIAMIRCDDGQLVPLPRPVGLKNESIEVIRPLAPKGTIGPRWEDRLKGTVAHLRPPPECVARADETAQPAWVVFPNFRPGAGTGSRRQRKGPTLLRLADNAFNYSMLGSVGFETMARLVHRCDCYEFRYSDLEQALKRFDDLPLPQPSPAPPADAAAPTPTAQTSPHER